MPWRQPGRGEALHGNSGAAKGHRAELRGVARGAATSSDPARARGWFDNGNKGRDGGLISDIGNLKQRQHEGGLLGLMAI